MDKVSLTKNLQNGNATSTNARVAQIVRKTNETSIDLTLNLDGTGICNVDCPVGFLKHLLCAFCKHGMFDLTGSLKGDLEVDQHHLVEDTGITLGLCFDKALADKRGIMRAGFFIYPMDETLARAAVDFGGRSYLVCNAELTGIPLVGGVAQNDGFLCTTFETDTFEDFWMGFVNGAKCNLHLDILRGRSDHHKMEGLFKAVARAMRCAVAIDERAPNSIPSTKGAL